MGTAGHAPMNHGELRQALWEEWDNIPMWQINGLIHSMHRHIRAAITANGGHTRYCLILLGLDADAMCLKSSQFVRS